jgi:hypothetical protein
MTEAGNEPTKFKKTHKALKAFKEYQLPKSPADIDKMMENALDKVPFSDYIIMASGFYAGFHGFTPATMMLGLFGVGKKMPSYTIFGIEVPDPMGFVSTAIKNMAAQNPELAAKYGITGQAGEFPLEIKFAYGCVGLIEAYMMTRPGAMGAMLNFVTGMAQATAAGIDALIPG